MKLTLKNFQSHKHSELELKPFTVIVGHSSSGKTAIFRALKAVLFNTFSKSFISHGKKESEVTISEDNCAEISAKRGTSTTYTVGDEVYGALGKAQLPELVEKGYYPIEVDKKKYYPQVSGQWDSPFIISFSDAEVSKVLAELSQTGIVKKAKKKIVSEISSFSKTIEIRQKDRESLQNQIVSLGDVVSQKANLDKLLKSQEELVCIQENVLKLEQFRDSMKDLKPISAPNLPLEPFKLIRLMDVLNKPKKIAPESNTAAKYLSDLGQLQDLQSKLMATVKETHDSKVIIKKSNDDLEDIKGQLTVCPTCLKTL